jgi:hypothetical protein
LFSGCRRRESQNPHPLKAEGAAPKRKATADSSIRSE